MISYPNLDTMPSMRSRRDDHTEATRAALLRAARRHFGKRGFAGAALGDIARDGRMTTGALYHHFASKQALFQAVAEQVETELLAQAAQVTETDPWRRLTTSFRLLVDACAAHDVQQIIFLDAPHVMGPAAWRQIELKYAYGALRTALASLQKQGSLGRYTVDLLAPVLLAILRETSQAIVAAKGSDDVRAQIDDLLARLFAALRTA
jgi:AcrR family transcriptional regulator